MRLIEKFYFWAYRIPENGNFNELDYSCAVPPCTLLSTPSHYPDSPGRNTDSDPVVLQPGLEKKSDRTRLGHFEKSWSPHRFPLWRPGLRPLQRFSARETRIISWSTSTRRFFGFWARPTHALRLNFDLEHTNYDNVIVRMAPRKESTYRFQTSYNPRPWAVLGGSVNILEDGNADSLTNYVGHNRNYGLTASLTPRETFSLDLAYNYNDVIQNALICFSDTPPIGVTLPFVTNAGSCAANDPANPLLGNSFYTNHTQFGMATVRFKFDKRTTINVGGSFTNVDGSVPQFNILQPLGSAQYKYFQPVVNLSVDLGHQAGLEYRLELLPVQRGFVCRADGATLFSREFADRVSALRVLISCRDAQHEKCEHSFPTEWSLNNEQYEHPTLHFAAALALILSVPCGAHAQDCAATYKAKCAGCHGADGKANTAPAKALGAHDFASDEVTKMSDADLIQVVTAGKNKMPAYGKSLKDAEIKDLVAYVRELAKQIVWNCKETLVA